MDYSQEEGRISEDKYPWVKDISYSQIRIYKKGTTVIGSQKVYVYELRTRAMTLHRYSAELQKILLRAQKEANKEEKGKKRSKNPPARRQKCNSKKEAYQAAKRAGKGKEPIHHPNNSGQGPHYHPNVNNNQRLTPKKPSVLTF